jgi:hypothetical protein
MVDRMESTQRLFNTLIVYLSKGMSPECGLFQR